MGNVTTLLFDLGGVLIELGPLDDMMASSPFDADTIWQNWTRSPSVTAFESGQCDASEFAENMVHEFQLSVSPATFLEKFKAWPRGTFDGAGTLLDTLAGHYQLACLSNTNIAHYEAFLVRQPILGYFEHLFLSHQTGLLKPETSAFRQVLDALDISEEQILFLDDNPGNVQAARSLGMNAACVYAPNGVIDALEDLGLHP